MGSDHKHFDSQFILIENQRPEAFKNKTYSSVNSWLKKRMFEPFSLQLRLFLEYNCDNEFSIKFSSLQNLSFFHLFFNNINRSKELVNQCSAVKPNKHYIDMKCFKIFFIAMHMLLMSIDHKQTILQFYNYFQYLSKENKNWDNKKEETFCGLIGSQ